MDSYNKPKTATNNNTTTTATSHHNTWQKHEEKSEQAEGATRVVSERAKEHVSTISTMAQHAHVDEVVSSSVRNIKNTFVKNDMPISEVKKNFYEKTSASLKTGFDNTRIAPFVKGTTKEGLNSAESKLSNQGDFQSDTVAGLIKTAKFSASTLKVAQVTTDIGIKATPIVAKASVKTTVNVGKGVYEVGNQTVKTAITAVQAFNIIKGANITPISKEALRVVKCCAIGTGLANTKISQRLVNVVNNTKTAIVGAGNKVKTTVNNAVKTVASGIRTVRNEASLFTFFIANKNYKFAMYQAERLASNFGRKAIMGSMGVVRGGVKVAKPVVKGVVKATPVVARVGVKTAKVGLKGANIAKGGVVGISSVFATSDDYALRGIATAVQFADVSTKAVGVGARTASTVGKGIGRVGIKTAKGSVKAVKGVSAWANLVRTNGWKKAMAEVGKRAGKGAIALLKNGGSSAVSAILNVVSTLGKKYIVPILIIVVAINGGVSVLSAPIMAVASTIGGIFSGRDDTTDAEEEFDVEEFMLNSTYGVPIYSSETKSQLQTNITNDGNNFHIVRLRQLGEVIATDANSIASSFYSDEEIAQMLMPIFNAVVYHKYDGSPKMSQAKNLLKDMYKDVFKIEAVQTTEYCGQELSTGAGQPNTMHYCGVIHAIVDPTQGDVCPNCITGVHDTYTCDECCDTAYRCAGHMGVANCGTTAHVHGSWCCDIPTHSMCTHEACGAYWAKDANGNYIGNVCSRYHDHNSGCNRNVCGNQAEHSHTSWSNENNTGCYSTVYCSSHFYVNGVGLRNSMCGNSVSYFYCNGYGNCGGHKVKTYSLDLEGIEKLVKKNFTDRINSLKNKNNRNDAEEEELSTLEDYYEIYLVTMDEFAKQGRLGTISLDEIYTIQFDDPTLGNRDVVQMALSQIGNAGGSKYWSYCGLSQRNEWSACFVEWCMRNTPSASSCYPYTGDNTRANSIALYYDSINNLKSGGWGVARAGDLIFFDVQGDYKMDRMGIIIGTTDGGDYIYAVEGNSADAVRIKKYHRSNSQIYGWAWVDY